MKEYGAEQSVRRIGHAPSGAVELLCARPAVAAAVGVGSKAGGGAVDLAVYTGAVLDSLSTPFLTLSLSLRISSGQQQPFGLEGASNPSLSSSSLLLSASVRFSYSFA